MHNRTKVLFLLLTLSQSSWAQEPPEEIIVVGRQPGSPMWLVKNGANELWIFAHLSPIPKDMIWESDKVAAVIARSQEALGMPNTGVKASPLLYLNPVNIFRGMRLAKRLSKNPDGEDLEEVLPPELYARFAALKAQYFPRDKDIEKLRPIAAGGRLSEKVQQAAGLVEATDVRRQIRRLIKRNKHIKQTPIQVNMEIRDSYGNLAERAETLVESLSPALELACFETQLTRMETDIPDMQRRADSWARGYIDEFRHLPLRKDDDNPCMQMVYASSEQQTLEQLTAEMNELWLSSAENALANNKSTFAILGISDLLSEQGLLAQLKARGYEVREP